MGAEAVFGTRAMSASWALTGQPSASRLARPITNAVAHAPEKVSVPHGGRFPMVVTVHDVAALLRPELVGSRLARFTRASWRRAGDWAGIVVPSESTRGDVTALGIDPSRVHLIRHGLSPAFASAPSDAGNEFVDRLVGDRPFLLAVGAPTRKKGGDVLLAAWRSISGLEERLLVWVSSRRGGEDDSTTSTITWVDEIGDRMLVALYARARALICPSRWEGYSFTVAEALAAGTPVIASDIPAHREFGDDGIRLFESEDTEALRVAIETALRDGLPSVRHSFPTWEECARRHVAVWRAVAG